MRTLLLALLPALCWAAVPGVPEPPTPGPAPWIWLGWGNDFFAPSVTGDDYRTNQLRAVIWGDRLIVGVDYALLTLRDDKVRLDETTVVAGYPLFNEDEATLAFGLGVRLRGSHGGQDLQNGFHDLLNDDKVTLRYIEADSEPLAWALLTMRNRYIDDDWYPELILSGLTMQHTAQYDIRARFVHAPEDQDGMAWLGLGFLGRDDRSSLIGYEVADLEEGIAAELGCSGRHWSFSLSYNITTGAGVGEIGLRF